MTARRLKIIEDRQREQTDELWSQFYNCLSLEELETFAALLGKHWISLEAGSMNTDEFVRHLPHELGSKVYAFWTPGELPSPLPDDLPEAERHSETGDRP